MKACKELKEYVELVYPYATKRAKWAIDELLSNGSLTSSEMLEFGHMHPARVICDVRDQGIPVETTTIFEQGKRYASYKLGKAKDINRAKFGGRKTIPTCIKHILVARNGMQCQLSKATLQSTDLEVDHRIPFALAGEPKHPKCPSNYMLLSRSMQMKKSKECAGCPNLKKLNSVDNCNECYWASPEHYTHKAMRQEQVTSINWTDKDAISLAKIRELALSHGLSVESLIKNTLTAIY